MYLKQSNSSIPLHIQHSDLNTFITLFLFIFAFSLLLPPTTPILPPTTPILFAILCKHSSLLAISSASSANSKLLTLHWLRSLSFNQTPAFNILVFHSFITPSLNKLNSHDNITHPCFEPTVTSKLLLSSLHTLTLTLLFS